MATVLQEVPEMTETTEAVTRLRNAQESNPLRVWRKRSGATLQEIAALVQRSVSIIQRWETGANTPNDSDWPRLEALTENAQIRQEWIAWLNQVPRL